MVIAIDFRRFFLSLVIMRVEENFFHSAALQSFKIPLSLFYWVTQVKSIYAQGIQRSRSSQCFDAFFIVWDFILFYLRE